jgi:hypothetical protein
MSDVHTTKFDEIYINKNKIGNYFQVFSESTIDLISQSLLLFDYYPRN